MNPLIEERLVMLEKELLYLQHTCNYEELKYLRRTILPCLWAIDDKIEKLWYQKSTNKE